MRLCFGVKGQAVRGLTRGGIGFVCVWVIFMQSAQARPLQQIRPENALLCSRVADQSVPVAGERILDTMLIGRDQDRRRDITSMQQSTSPQAMTGGLMATFLAGACSEGDGSLHCQIQGQPFTIGLEQRDRFTIQLSGGQVYVCLIRTATNKQNI